MNRMRHGGTRRFSLVRLEVSSPDSNTLTPSLYNSKEKIFFIYSFF
jgi:hypothetical protein